MNRLPLFFALLLLIGCGSDSADSGKLPDPGDGVVSKSVIRNYYIPSVIEPYGSLDGTTKIAVMGEQLTSSETLKMAKINGDTMYNDVVPFLPSHALVDSLKAVSLYTVDYFDAAHPAGADISDIAYLYYESYYDFLKGRYAPVAATTSDDGMTLSASLAGFATTYRRPLAEVNVHDTQILSAFFAVKVWSLPDDKEKDYTMRLKMEFANSTAEGNITMNFRGGE